MKRTIYLPAIDRHVTLGQYIRAVRYAKANPDATFTHGLTCWWACSGREIVAQFTAGVMDRINQARPYIERGREPQKRQ